MYGCLYVCMYVWMDGYMYVGLDVWMYGCRDGWIWMDVCMYVCVVWCFTGLWTADLALGSEQVITCFVFAVLFLIMRCK
jgi:hypothetical protein